ncbi:MAG TPA: DUF971 domain-containing protein [Gammaproteobacteria bacterium]|nr:DUF971 domain-containing protein [Gammaproteobacteria bacterium]
MHPTEIKIRKAARCVDIRFDDGAAFSLPFEYLRVYSPSAEVRGHGPGQELLPIGKENVRIVRTVPVGNYAVQFVFDDGHDSGLYSWQTLYELGRDYEQNWQRYRKRLENVRYKRAD